MDATPTALCSEPGCKNMAYSSESGKSWHSRCADCQKKQPKTMKAMVTCKCGKPAHPKGLHSTDPKCSDCFYGKKSTTMPTTDASCGNPFMKCSNAAVSTNSFFGKVYCTGCWTVLAGGVDPKKQVMCKCGQPAPCNFPPYNPKYTQCNKCYNANRTATSEANKAAIDAAVNAVNAVMSSSSSFNRDAKNE